MARKGKTSKSGSKAKPVEEVVEVEDITGLSDEEEEIPTPEVDSPYKAEEEETQVPSCRNWHQLLLTPADPAMVHKVLRPIQIFARNLTNFASFRRRSLKRRRRRSTSA